MRRSQSGLIHIKSTSSVSGDACVSGFAQQWWLWSLGFCTTPAAQRGLMQTVNSKLALSLSLSTPRPTHPRLTNATPAHTLGFTPSVQFPRAAGQRGNPCSTFAFVDVRSPMIGCTRARRHPRANTCTPSARVPTVDRRQCSCPFPSRLPSLSLTFLHVVIWCTAWVRAPDSHLTALNAEGGQLMAGEKIKPTKKTVSETTKQFSGANPALDRTITTTVEIPTPRAIRMLRHLACPSWYSGEGRGHVDTSTRTPTRPHTQRTILIRTAHTSLPSRTTGTTYVIRHLHAADRAGVPHYRDGPADHHAPRSGGYQVCAYGHHYTHATSNATGRFHTRPSPPCPTRPHT